MSTILKAASAAAVAIYTIATFVMTDASAAFATPLIAEMIQQEPAPTQDIEPDIASAELVAAKDAETSHAVDRPVSPNDLNASEPMRADTLAQLVAQHDATSALDAEAQCLAATVYFESKGESLLGQLAVAKVVLARRDSHRFPNTICAVVYQPSQFSFVRGGSMPSIPTASRHWANAVAIAKIALADHWDSPVEGALFFHARHVSPGWRMQRMAAVDNHIFYR